MLLQQGQFCRCNTRISSHFQPIKQSFQGYQRRWYTQNSRRSIYQGPNRRNIIQCSILGVGAPEAVLVGVVALIVFGPKGLAEAAKSLGQALRSFQPTIKELTQVSSEIRNTLEEEIGLDEIRRDLSGYPSPRQSVSQKIESDALQQGNLVNDPKLEEMRKDSTQAAWGGKPPLNADTPIPVPTSADQVTVQNNGVSEQKENKDLGDLSTYSLDELQAELEKRKK